MNKAIKTVFLLVFATLVGCDKVEGPYGSPIATNGGGDTTVQIIRKVLVEDFTGHTCGNCPRAAESLHQIEELYGNQIVSVAIHAGFFAAPSGTHYSSDYRTQVGNDLDQFFGNSAAGLPNGLVNRNMFGGTSAITQHTDWASKVSTLINLPPEAFMTISPNYTAASRLLTINVTTKILQNINEPLSIVYYLTEDSIQSPQKDYSLPSPSSIDNYYHRHMLRGSMNGAWGNTLGDGTTYSQNQEISTSSSFTIPAGWNPNKVSVVALIYRTASKESVQVEEKKIIN